MKPVTATVDVPESRTEVFDFLDVLANHERFTDHFLVDWELSGPAGGVGAKARMRVKSRGFEDRIEMTVVASERPRMTAEESVGAEGRRRTRGTYILADLPDGGTRIAFELRWLEAPLAERLLAPITRWVVGRANRKALRRLVGVLAGETKEETR